MTEARFLQIHTLHSYSSVLLNRDDSGLAKRLPYGGVTRTRISSQCLKRHWRLADDPHALSRIAGFVDSKRSRELVTRQVLEPLAAEFAPATMTALNELFQVTVYGENGTKLDGRQTLLFGNPELNWLATQARELAPRIQQAIAETGDAPIAALPAATKGRRKAGDASKGANKAVEAVTKDWKDTYKANMKVLREQTALPGGLAAALFGRMVTSDTAANIDAPIHVAHAFTVHGEESDSDYLTAVDDLKGENDDAGAGTIQETEVGSGLFYGYVVIDVPGLVANTAACKREAWLGADRTLAADVVQI